MIWNILRGLLIALLALGPLPALAAQAPITMPIVGPMSMGTFTNTYLNPALAALASCESGTTAPNTAGAGGNPITNGCWWDTSGGATAWVLRYYDGAQWVPFITLNTATHALANGYGILGPAAAGAILCNPTVSAAALQNCLPATSGSPKAAFVNHGTVLMTRLPQSYTWTVFDANGAIVNISSSTTGGLQEAINTAATQGVCLDVKGGGQTSPGSVETDWGTINATTTITFPASTKACWNVDGVSLEMLMATAANDGVVFDSWDMSSFRFRGQLIYSGTGSALHTQPTTPNQESFTGGTSAIFDIGSIVCVVSNVNLAPDPTKGIGFRVSSPFGVTIGNRFGIHEINGCIVGRQIDNPGGGQSTRDNFFVTPTIHNNNGTSSVVGTSSGGTAIFGNTFEDGLNPIGGTGALTDWGINNNYKLSIDSGGVGVIENTSSAGNIYIVAKNAAASPCSDGSTAHTNLYIGNDCPAMSRLPGTNTNNNALAGDVGEYIESNCVNQNSTVTVTIASPAVVTWTGHGYRNNPPPGDGGKDACPIVFTTTGALPTGLSLLTTYWVIPSSITTNTFQVANSLANALTGTAVNTSGSQSGVQTATSSVYMPVANQGTVANVTGLALTAGDWMCTASAFDIPSGSAVVTNVAGSINTASATFNANPDHGGIINNVGSATGVSRLINWGPKRFSQASSFNIFMSYITLFSGAAQTDNANGFVGCRRAR